MSHKTVAEFRAEREAQNKLLLELKHKQILRFLNVDRNVYEDGALPAQTKEMLGLAASVVLRCDDCITYPMIKTVELGITDAELGEIFAVAVVVGGSITIPHLRRAAATRAELRAAAT